MSDKKYIVMSKFAGQDRFMLEKQFINRHSADYYANLMTEEKDYKEKYDLTDEQLYWRRLKIVEGGVDKFRQEYPANSEEAFLVSGASVFDSEKINSFKPTPPIALRGYNDDLGSFDDSPRGNLEIWIPPDWQDNYIIGADVALGVKQDYSTAIVMNTKGHICAMYRDNTVDPTLYIISPLTSVKPVILGLSKFTI